MGDVTDLGDAASQSVDDDVDRAATDAHDSFDDVFAQQSVSLVRLATLLTGSFAIAEEVVQEAFVGLLRRWDTVDAPTMYLRTAVVNGCHSHGRRISVARRHAPRFEPPLVASTEPDIMQDAIAHLPLRQRTAVVLRYWLDLSEHDIAEHLGCRPGTVKSLLSRALANLREEVDQ
jgi:RNA polymerase sigma-70 factor (sigma-E family)